MEKHVLRLAQGRERVRHLSEATAKGSRQHNCVFCLCALQLLAKAESEASRLCLQNSLYQRCLTMCLSVKPPHTGKKSIVTSFGCSSFQRAWAETQL